MAPPTVPRTPKETSRRRRESPADGTSQKRRKTVQILLLFVTLVLAIDGLVGEKGLLESIRARQRHRELSTSIERLRAENAQLREDARKLLEDPSTIESLAREELGLIRPGELLFIVKDARPAH